MIFKPKNEPLWLAAAVIKVNRSNYLYNMKWKRYKMMFSEVTNLGLATYQVWARIERQDGILLSKVQELQSNQAELRQFSLAPGPCANFTAHWNVACNTQWMENTLFISAD